MAAHRGFKPEYVDQAHKLCLLNQIDEDIAKFFGISKKTLYAWQKKHPELREAMRNGKIPADGRVAAKLYERATGAEWFEEHAVKVKRVVFDAAGKRQSEIEEIQIIRLRKGDPPDTGAGIFWMKNRQKWQDRPAEAPESNGQLDKLVQLAKQGPAKIEPETE